jgi:hypothetical protein
MVVAQLKDKGYVTRGWLDVQIQPVTTGIADSLGMKKARQSGAGVSAPRHHIFSLMPFCISHQLTGYEVRKPQTIAAAPRT